MTRSRVGSKYPMRMDMAFFAPIVNAVCLKGTGRNILLGRATPTNGIFGNHRSEDTPLRRSLPRAQCYERIEYHPVDLQALAECTLAGAKCPLGLSSTPGCRGVVLMRSISCVTWRSNVSAGPKRSGRKVTKR